MRRIVLPGQPQASRSIPCGYHATHEMAPAIAGHRHVVPAPVDWSLCVTLRFSNSEAEVQSSIDYRKGVLCTATSSEEASALRAQEAVCLLKNMQDVVSIYDAAAEGAHDCFIGNLVSGLQGMLTG